MAGVEDTIFANIESATGESFLPPDDTPATEQTGGQQPDHELDQVDQQLRSRGQPRQEDDNQLPGFVKKPLDQRRKDEPRQEQPQGKVDEYGNPIGSKSFYITRRLKGQVDNLRSVNTSMKSQVDDLTRQLAEARVLNDLPKQLGLSNDETAELVHFAAVLKGNPTEGARKVIEVALARGANLKDIINDEFIPNITLGATQRLLDQRLGPIQEEQKNKGEVDQQTREMETQARQFLADYPEAQLHGEVIADQMTKIERDYQARGVPITKYMAAEKAYQRLEDFCNRNQLNIHEPLAPQLQARQQSPTGAKSNTPPRQSPRPIPNGSSGGEVVTRKTKTAEADDSWNSIVREALVESGYSLNN